MPDADGAHGRTLPTGRFQVHRIERDSWQGVFDGRQQDEALLALEAGGLIFLPRLAFALADGELPLLSSDCVRPGSKHVGFDPGTGALRGTEVDRERAAALRAMMSRYARDADGLVRSLFPRYRHVLRMARTSFRPVEAAGRSSSWRKDDRRLHVDAFPSRPNQGRRLLRVFTNVDPEGRDRVWNVGEPFEEVARRFLPSIRRPLPGQARLLHALGITRSLRTEYDHIMLELHDRMKADPAYQAGAVSEQLRFPSGSSWIVQTDVVSHAALAGRFMLEQTFLMPVHGMLDPARSPLRILERLAGRSLV
jgi:hypothetical protein